MVVSILLSLIEQAPDATSQWSKLLSALGVAVMVNESLSKTLRCIVTFFDEESMVAVPLPETDVDKVLALESRSVMESFVIFEDTSVVQMKMYLFPAVLIGMSHLLTEQLIEVGVSQVANSLEEHS